MGAHEKVGHDSLASRPPPTTLAPQAARRARGLGGDRIEPHSDEPHGLVEGIVGGKVSPHLRPDDLARDERPLVVRLSQRGPGRFSVFGISPEDIQQD